MQSRLSQAVVDYIGFPFHVPGNLEVRLARTLYLPDGSVIDQGTRSTKFQRGCHRFVVERKQDIVTRVAEQVVKGFSIGSYRAIKKAAEFQWRPEVLDARLSRAMPNEVTPRLHLRALGFDLVGAGELAIGVSKLTVLPGEVFTTQKANLLLCAWDPIQPLFVALDEYAERVGYEPLPLEDKALVEHMAAFVRRHQYYTEQAPNHSRMAQVEKWETVPMDLQKETIYDA